MCGGGQQGNLLLTYGVGGMEPRPALTDAHLFRVYSVPLAAHSEPEQKTIPLRSTVSLEAERILGVYLHNQVPSSLSGPALAGGPQRCWVPISLCLLLRLSTYWMRE